MICYTAGAGDNVTEFEKVAAKAGSRFLVVLRDTTVEIADLLIKWIYDDFYGSPSLPEAAGLLQVSHKLDIIELQQHCGRILSSFVSTDTCLQLADLARHCESSTLREVCLLHAFPSVAVPTAHSCSAVWHSALSLHADKDVRVTCVAACVFDPYLFFVFFWTRHQEFLQT